MPPRKAGLWEVQTKFSIDGREGARPTTVAHYCIDAATEQLMGAIRSRLDSERCRAGETHRAGYSITTEWSCKVGDMTTTSRRRYSEVGHRLHGDNHIAERRWAACTGSAYRNADNDGRQVDWRMRGRPATRRHHHERQDDEYPRPTAIRRPVLARQISAYVSTIPAEEPLMA